MDALTCMVPVSPLANIPWLPSLRSQEREREDIQHTCISFTAGNKHENWKLESAQELQLVSMYGRRIRGKFMTLKANQLQMAGLEEQNDTSNQPTNSLSIGILEIQNPKHNWIDKWLMGMVDIFQTGLKNCQRYKPLRFRAQSLTKCSEAEFKIISYLLSKKLLKPSETADTGCSKNKIQQSHVMGWILISI